MAEVGNPVTQGIPTTLDATDEFVVIGVGITSSLVDILLQFNGTWNGTVGFDKGRLVSGTLVWDDVTATNVNGAATGTTSAGGASAVEDWRIDASGYDAIRVYADSVVAGSVNVTYKIVQG